jgi:hypothetical protein
VDSKNKMGILSSKNQTSTKPENNVTHNQLLYLDGEFSGGKTKKKLHKSYHKNKYMYNQ